MKTQIFITLIIIVIASSAITLAQGPKKVDINFATLEELQTLPGVGPEIARAILDGRPYMNKKELQKVAGMGEKKFRRLQRLIVVKPLVINLATLDELKLLPGIEPEIAQAIIDGRPYEKEEDLLRVKGMDEEKFKKIQSLIEMKLNINSATVYELETLPGIGQEIAKAIVENRPYKEVDELLRVKGIGEDKLAKIRDLIEAKPARKTGDARRGRKIPITR